MHTSKQQWSAEETSCFLAVWSSAEVQDQLEGASRTKPVFVQIQREMAAAGYDRTIEQISNKLKKLKKEYRDQKKDLISRGGIRRPKTNSTFEILDSVLGDRLSTGALNSATAMLEVMVDNNVTLPQTGPELSAIKEEEEEEAKQELTLPLNCSSPTPSPSSSSGESHNTRPGKRKRDSNAELLEYLQRSDERFLQHSKDLHDALLQKMEADTNAFLGLMGRMVSLLEAQARK